MSKPEIYISIDIEADGPTPGINSMLSLGAAAFTLEGGQQEVGTFYRTIHPMLDCTADPATMKWWATQPEAWTEVTTKRVYPRDAIWAFEAWVDGLRAAHKPVTVAWPASYDFPFVAYYSHKFLDRCKLGFSCMDIRSYADGLANQASYFGLDERKLRRLVKTDREGLRPHVAVDDAIEQGRLLIGLIQLAISRRTAI